MKKIEQLKSENPGLVWNKAAFETFIEKNVKIACPKINSKGSTIDYLDGIAGKRYISF